MSVVGIAGATLNQRVRDVPDASASFAIAVHSGAPRCVLSGILGQNEDGLIRGTSRRCG